jgi:hypothetical protein
VLQPLTERLRRYDVFRKRIERKGGRLADLRLVTRLLGEPIPLDSTRGRHEVRLSSPEDLRQTFWLVGARNVYLSVRQRPSGLPAYYLVRIKYGYWSEYSLLVEDLYCSPDYPHPDERFVKLMDYGHETYFLRLSQFRKGVAAMLGADRAADEWRVDDVLHNVGRQIFQAAWHEDQYPAFEAAASFDLPDLRQAIELLYLCLSGDLCAIRASIDTDISDFFLSVYPHPAIHRFLQGISELEGNTLARLPDKAIEIFARLSRAYSRFLRVEVRHGPRGCSLPLYKLLFANFGRLGLVTQNISGDGDVATAAAELEKQSRDAIQEIANCCV